MTVSVVLAVAAPEVAVISEVPALTPSARPEALIVATAGVPDTNVEFAVTSAVELSLKVPVTLNCCEAPMAIDGLSGAIAIEVHPVHGDVAALAFRRRRRDAVD